MRGFGREAQVPALLDAYEIPYTFSDPLVLGLCLHKGLTKSGCRDAGRVDLREDEQGRLCFLEMNPLAGLHPTHSDLPIICRLKDISYLQLIAEILEAANSRRLHDSRRLTMG